MQAFSKFNRGVKYLLAVIDVFSKYGWLIPLKDKTGKSVASALKTIFKERKPEKMWVDKGKEFYNKDVKDLIELYSTENEEKSSVVERWIRRMKEKMWKYFTANSTNNFINVLSDLVKEYNTRHSSIKVQFQPKETCVFFYFFPDCLCIIIIFSASPTTIRARVLCLFAQVCKRKNPISEPSLDLAVILVTSRYEDNTLSVNSEQ